MVAMAFNDIPTERASSTFYVSSRQEALATPMSLTSHLHSSVAWSHQLGRSLPSTK
jgi:hypothetical protein